MISTNVLSLDPSYVIPNGGLFNVDDACSSEQLPLGGYYPNSYIPIDREVYPLPRATLAFEEADDDLQGGDFYIAAMKFLVAADSSDNLSVRTGALRRLVVCMKNVGPDSLDIASHLTSLSDTTVYDEVKYEAIHALAEIDFLEGKTDAALLKYESIRQNATSVVDSTIAIRRAMSIYVREAMKTATDETTSDPDLSSRLAALPVYGEASMKPASLSDRKEKSTVLSNLAASTGSQRISSRLAPDLSSSIICQAISLANMYLSHISHGTLV